MNYVCLTPNFEHRWYQLMLNSLLRTDPHAHLWATGPEYDTPNMTVLDHSAVSSTSFNDWFNQVLLSTIQATQLTEFILIYEMMYLRTNYRELLFDPPSWNSQPDNDAAKLVFSLRKPYRWWHTGVPFLVQSKLATHMLEGPYSKDCTFVQEYHTRWTQSTLPPVNLLQMTLPCDSYSNDFHRALTSSQIVTISLPAQSGRLYSALTEDLDMLCE